MKIAQKLKLNSPLVLALLALNIFVAIFLVQRMIGDVRQLTEVEEPLNQAALEMEINAAETSQGVLHHLWSAVRLGRMQMDDTGIRGMHDKPRLTQAPRPSRGA